MAVITKNPSVDLLADYFRGLDYSFEKFSLGDRSYTRFISPRGLSWLTRDAHISYPFLHVSCHNISGLKDLAYELCEKLNVSAPWTIKVDRETSPAVLEDCLKRGTLVVKPRSASLSRGVSLNVKSMAALRQAIKSALEFASIALVQQQMTGEEVRLVILDGKARAAILRQTPRITGNGTSTIAELLAAENQERTTLKMKYLAYPQLTDEIIDFSHINMDEVPPVGQMIELGRGTMIKTGASVYNVIDEIDPSYLRTAEKLANVLGARFVVVDLMIQDFKQPQTSENYAFIEFNTAPVLKLFYSCRDGKHYDVLTELGAMIDISLQGART